MKLGILRKTLITVALLGPVALGAGAFAQGGNGYGAVMGPSMMEPGMMAHDMMDGMGYGMLSRLNLSPEQSSKVNAIHDEVAKQRWELMAGIREEAFTLQNLLAAEERDRAVITGQYKKLQVMRLQLLHARLDEHERLNSVLTSEQKEQFRHFASSWHHDIE